MDITQFMRGYQDARQRRDVGRFCALCLDGVLHAHFDGLCRECSIWWHSMPSTTPPADGNGA